MAGCSSSAIVSAVQGDTKVLTDWPVAAIDSQLVGGVVVRRRDGEEIRAACVVVTVPVSVLQRGHIRFSPPLPRGKLQAIKAVDMGNAVKVFVKVARKFWPDDFYDVVCSDSFLPEIWLTPASEAMRADHTGSYVLVGFVTGKRAEKVAELPEERIVHLMCLQLDGIFGTKEDARPASDSVEEWLVKNWVEEEFCYGAYSHPSVRATEKTRGALAAPLDGKVFFAGEATHVGINVCMQGAIETGRRAAREVVEALEKRKEGVERTKSRL